MRRFIPCLLSFILSACTLFEYQPLATLDHIDRQRGYRLEAAFDAQEHDDGLFLVLLFSGGGSRAAAFGYGVLEVLAATPITGYGKTEPLLAKIDLVHGVSGGSILATYLALHGTDTVPQFERAFLRQNLQSAVLRQLFSFANLPRLTAPEFGRGDLLAEELDRLLYQGATFAALDSERKGPFAVISATDMSIGQRIEFTQEYFDALCLDLNRLPIARAVAASSAVPLVFAPLTLNNHGGHCHYRPPPRAGNERAVRRFTAPYQDSAARPYIHLLDGGLTDNLGLRSLLDFADIYGGDNIYRHITDGKVRDVVVISVNAQNRLDSSIDQSPAIPGMYDVASAIINVPIDENTRESVRNFRRFVDDWNARGKQNHVALHFIDLNLSDLPDGTLKRQALNIGTTFYLPEADIRALRQSAKILLEQNPTYRNLPGLKGNRPALPADPQHLYRRKPSSPAAQNR